MPGQLQFFDMSVSVTPPSGHHEPLPITLGPNWQPNDIRLLFISASGSEGATSLMMPMTPDPPTGFTAAYALNIGRETHGVYYRRLQPGDTDTSVEWTKPPGWRHFMMAMLTVRGVSPTANPTAGSLGVSYTAADTTDSGTVDAITVPGPGAIVLMIGNVPAPTKVSWPSWAVAMGVPDGWTHLVATEKSGQDFFEYDTSPSLMVVGKTFESAGSTGPIEFPANRGTPAFAAMYAHLTPAEDVSAEIGAA